MNKTRRRRQRRAAHEARVRERNLLRGFTSGDLNRLGATDVTANDRTIEEARAKTNLGHPSPSYHKPRHSITHADEIELFEQQGTVWSTSNASTTPSQEEWDEVVAHSKRRRRSIKTFASKKGWILVDGADPKQRESWYTA